jgi:putative PIN family toxin of toxin-antitoxin system
MIRVVFDTNVLFSAILQNKGQPARVFDLVTAGLILPCVSDAVLDEYRDVLFRPALAAHVDRAKQVLDILANIALHVTPTEKLNISEDEDDNRIYECADAAMADYIITGNTRHFRESYKATQIVNARQLLQLFEEK